MIASILRDFLLFASIKALYRAVERHSEEAAIAILPDQSVHVLFHFTTHRDPTPENRTTHLVLSALIAVGYHYFLFPRPIGDIVAEFNVEEMHLAFTRYEPSMHVCLQSHCVYTFMRLSLLFFSFAL